MIIDTRDLNVRLNEYEDMVSQMEDIKDEIVASSDDDDIESLEQDQSYIMDEFDEEEYEILYQMRDEIPEWEHGNILVSDDEWTDYVKDLLKDTGEIPSYLPSYIIIDWDATAYQIQQDYSCIDYEGEIYWYRNC